LFLKFTRKKLTNHTIDLSKPVDAITEKFDDNEAMQRLVQCAVSAAVDKTRKLRILPAPNIQEEATTYLTNHTRSSQQDTDERQKKRKW